MNPQRIEIATGGITTGKNIMFLKVFPNLTSFEINIAKRKARKNMNNPPMKIMSKLLSVVSQNNGSRMSSRKLPNPTNTFSLVKPDQSNKL
jgi:hypothetical protein